MDNEALISYKGVTVEVSTTDKKLSFTKGDYFLNQLNDQTKVIAENYEIITNGEHTRRWLHKKLDDWIDMEKNKS